MPEKLSIQNHDRYTSGMQYVYPVVSRRAGGVSIGINLNPNNACNWRCIYCQVPGLSRGGPPNLDLSLLRQEFSGFLDQVLHGDFMQRCVEPEYRRLNDVAFSGNGEPTTSAQFADAIGLVNEVMAQQGGDVVALKRVLITNGSRVGQPAVMRGLEALFRHHGEVWFKVDRATHAGIALTNDVHLDPDGVRERLMACARLGPTWVQTCWFRLDGQLPDLDEVEAYLKLVAAVHQVTPLAGVLLYSTARTSYQPEAQRIQRLAAADFDALAIPLRRSGLVVRVAP